MKLIISKRKGESIAFNYINETNLPYLLASPEYFIGSSERYVA